jgi:hypothetical protein
MSEEKEKSENGITNPAKKTVLLITAIFAMILGGIIILDVSLTFALSSGTSWLGDILRNHTIMPALMMTLLYAVGFIVLGALLCRFRANKGIIIPLIVLFGMELFTRPFLSLISLFDFDSLNISGYFTGFEVMFTMAGLVLSIVGICMSSKKREEIITPPTQGYFPPPPPPYNNGGYNQQFNPYNRPYYPPNQNQGFPPQNNNFTNNQNNQNNFSAPQNQQNQQNTVNSERDRKIAYLKELKDGGNLSEEEFNKLMLKELEK